VMDLCWSGLENSSMDWTTRHPELSMESWVKCERMMVSKGCSWGEGMTVINFWMTYLDLGLVMRERGPGDPIRREARTWLLSVGLADLRADWI